ncbi:hypothetical protein ACFQOZ_06260 [Comamonas endophytica]|uniref:hypothetical protein n=1 Tax=Comamonas endophytica TaxID=2949090 RepID=UPI00360F734F
MNSAARRIGREALLFSTLCATVLFGLSLVLISWHVQQLLTDLTQQRVLRLSQQVSLEADRGLRFGVGLPEQTAWLARLQQLDRQEPQLLGLQLQAMDGTLIAQAGDAQHAGAVRSAWHRQLAEAALTQPLVKQDSNRLHIGRTLADASGQASAQLWISIDLRSTQAQARAAGLRILGQLAPLLLLALALAWAALWRLGLQWQGAGHKRTTTALVLSATLVCAATPLAMVWSASDMARPLVARQIAANADAMARTLGQQIARAHALGIPWCNCRACARCSMMRCSARLNWALWRCAAPRARSCTPPANAVWQATRMRGPRRSSACFPRRRRAHSWWSATRPITSIVRRTACCSIWRWHWWYPRCCCWNARVGAGSAPPWPRWSRSAWRGVRHARPCAHPCSGGAARRRPAQRRPAQRRPAQRHSLPPRRIRPPLRS